MGTTQSTAALMLSAFVLGNLLLQLPLGWLADKAPRRTVLIGCALGAAIFGALVPTAFGGSALWLVLFLWGGLVFGFYTIGLTELGQRVDRTDIVSANTAFVMLYEVGTLLGPIVTGAAMDAAGRQAMPLSLAALSLVYATILVFRRITRRDTGAG